MFMCIRANPRPGQAACYLALKLPTGKVRAATPAEIKEFMAARRTRQES
jgi:hypothetical protein